MWPWRRGGWLMNELDELKAFEAFLSGIKLDAHHKKYAHIKLVELDMPREIQPLRLYGFNTCETISLPF